MSVNSSSEPAIAAAAAAATASNNATTTDYGSTTITPGDYTRIDWNPPGSEREDSVSTKNATLALKTAIAVARAFDANCALRNPAKECTIPMFEPQELVLGDALRSSGFFTDIGLRGIKLTRNLQHGEFSEEEEEFRERFAERSIDGHYAVKFLQKGMYNSVHAASAASDMMMETKILMNLAPHPNICQIYGVTAAGSDAFLSRGKEGFYIILDRLSGTMVQQLQTWREQHHADFETRKAKGDEDSAIALGQYEKLMQRLEVALDIGSALLFLSDRQIVFHVRPDKVGLDVRYGRIKLCDFGQARENGQLDQAPSLTKTDDIRTLAYTAPEVLCQAPVTVAADVYAYGVVLWEMLTLQHPFVGLSRSEHFERVVMNGERPEIPPNIPKVVQGLMGKCWDPYLRPTMKKVYDTVEEVLLFQDDKPDISQFPVVYRTPSAAASYDGTMPSKSKPPRQLRRTKTAEGEPRPRRRPARNHHSHDESGPMRDKSRNSQSHDESGGAERPMRDKSATSQTQDESSAGDRPMRDKSKTSQSHDESAGDRAMRDKSKTSNDDSGGVGSNGRVSRKSRTHKSSGHEKSNGHEVMKDRSRESNQYDASEKMRDESRDNMRDESKDSHASVSNMKDKSKGRSSRRRISSNTKKTSSEEASQSAIKTSATETQSATSTAGEAQTTDGVEKHNRSLPEVLQENEEEKAKEAEYVGDSMQVLAPSLQDKKTKSKSSQQQQPSLATIPSAADEADAEAEPKKLPGFHRSQTSTAASSSKKGPAFGRSQTTSNPGSRRSRKEKV